MGVQGMLILSEVNQVLVSDTSVRRRFGVMSVGWPAPVGIRVFAVIALVATMAACAGVAGAAVTHEPLFQLGDIPAEGPHGEQIAFPGPLRKMESTTIDSGRLWVAEGSGSEPSRVDEFDTETGAFLGQPIDLPVTPEAETHSPTCFGVGCGTGIAVGHALGEAVVYVAGERHGESVVSVFDETGALKSTWTGAGVPGGNFGINEVNGFKSGTVVGVAVDDSTDTLADPAAGDVYVTTIVKIRRNAQHGEEANSVIDVFRPEANGEEHYLGQIVGRTSSSEPIGIVRHVQVESSGDLIIAAHPLEVGGSAADWSLSIFEPTGTPGTYTLAREITGPPPNGVFDNIEALATDSSSGDIYVESSSANEYRIEQFGSGGTYLGYVGDTPDAFSVAVDPLSGYLFARKTVYGPDVVTPDVAVAAVSGLKPESVTLNGTVNPDGAGDATCEFEWGTSQSFGNVAPCSEAVPSGVGPVAVHASLSGLERDQTYYYRLKASNANGTNPGEQWQTMQFSTPGVLVREDFVSNVSATSATLGAKIDPGGTPTNYYFQYGPSSEYGERIPVALSGESIGSGAADVLVPAQHLQELSPAATYHYRVTAISEIAPGELETVHGADRTFTTQAAEGAFSLADGRQWELVSPPDKLGAPIEGLQGSQEGQVQASASGGAIAYRSGAPTEPEPSGFAVTATVLSARGADGWSSLNISAPNNHAAHVVESTGKEYQIFSEDLSHAALQPADSTFTPLSGEASEQTPYLRTDFTSSGGLCAQSCYRPLVTGAPGYANVPAGTVFGEEPTGACTNFVFCGPLFQGASPDLSHVVLSSPAQLTSTPAPPGGPGLYEWSGGGLQLVGVPPEGESGPLVLAGSNRRRGHIETGVRHAVSEDGERVIMEGGVEGGDGLYLREVGSAQTTRLDVPQGGSGPSQGLSYLTASGDASRIFFLDEGRLTASSSASGEDLYEYDLGAPAGSRLTDLSADPNAGEAAAVVEVFGASEDGSYVYFVARGALAPGAVPGGANLYVSHEGQTSLVAVLSNKDKALYAWEEGSVHSESQLARVSPDGRWLAFMSSAELTGYDTHDAVNGTPDAEVYLYDAASNSLVCASCNPTGARPAGLPVRESIAAGRIPHWTGPPLAYGSSSLRQPRYLSDSGRLFFDSADALVAQDVNGVEDVYEYEPAAVGNCTASSTAFVQGSGGCLNLVSAGTSPAGSELLDASETGGDLFFITQARLAPQDYDTAYDVYDAHECTSAVPCPPVAVQPPSCQTESSCRAAPTPQPALYGAPASATFTGIGNISPEAPVAIKPRSKSAISRAHKLAVALSVCRKKRDRHKRTACERLARAKYAPTRKASKSTTRSKHEAKKTRSRG